MLSTDRMNDLQMTILSMMRAMRSVFCGVFWQEGCFCAYVDCRLQYQSSFEAASKADVADEQLLDDPEGLTTYIAAFETACTHTHVRQAVPLVVVRGA
jgi:hypothetical protein